MQSSFSTRGGWPLNQAWLLSLGSIVLILVGSYRALADPLAVAMPTWANRGATLGQDFRDATYYPVKAFLAGQQPYDPEVMLTNWPTRQEFDLYAPYHLLLHTPLAAMPYQAAYILFSLVSLAYLIGIGLITARRFTVPGGWPAAWALGGLIVMAKFTKAALYFGQIDPQTAFGATLALANLGRSRRLVALGVALTWTKPQYAIPLTLLLIARHAFREVASGTALACLFSIPVLVPLVHRAGGVADFLAVCQRNIDYARAAEYSRLEAVAGARVDVAAVVFRLTGWTMPGAEAISALVIVGIVAVVVRRRRGELSAAEIMLITLAMRLSIYHMGNESMLHVVGSVGLVMWAIRERRVVDSFYRVLAVMCAIAAVLPGLYFHAISHRVITLHGTLVDSLVEPLLLLTSFSICLYLAFTRPVVTGLREVA
ncbi:MAG: hypothetical protein CSB46_04710 [Micrococcales bacterium]|nr:MAG: hypothetical protein CSB46_04710 [Micrococcales bacterium]